MLLSYIFFEEVIKLATRVERQQRQGGVRIGVTTSSATRAVSTPTRTWSTPKRDEKVEFSKGNTSSVRGLHFLIDQHTDVIQRKRKRFKGRSVSS